ncbi:MAG: DUF3276 family protein [Rikenellaceae bacterium]
MGIFNFSKNDSEPHVETPSHNDWGHRDNSSADEVFSVPVKAGKRIYYFDVKSTRAEDYYITITESRKKQLGDGTFAIDKHKIHLYKEDFAKFADGFSQVVAYVREHKPEFFQEEE